MRTQGFNDLVKRYVSRKDPQGYYVIFASPDALPIVSKCDNLIVENEESYIIIRTKSRRTAERLVRKLLRLKLIRV